MYFFLLSAVPLSLVYYVTRFRGEETFPLRLCLSDFVSGLFGGAVLFFFLRIFPGLFLKLREQGYGAVFFYQLSLPLFLTGAAAALFKARTGRNTLQLFFFLSGVGEFFLFSLWLFRTDRYSPLELFYIPLFFLIGLFLIILLFRESESGGDVMRKGLFSASAVCLFPLVTLFRHRGAGFHAVLLVLIFLGFFRLLRQIGLKKQIS